VLAKVRRKSLRRISVPSPYGGTSVISGRVSPIGWWELLPKRDDVGLVL
jgi:hypothetical protein